MADKVDIHDTGEYLKKIVTFVADETKRSETHWGEIALHVEKSSKMLDKGFLHAATQIVGLHAPLRMFAGTLVDAFTGSRTEAEKLFELAANAEVKMHSLRDQGRLNAQSDEYDAAVISYEKLKKIGDDHLAATESIAKAISSKWLVALPVFVGMLKMALNNDRMLNEAIIKANTSVEHRKFLMQEITNTQAATGASMENMAKASAALLRYGFDIKGNFRDTLNVVVQMEEGLGVSVDSAAEMAVMAQRIGSSMRQVADGIARVQADTALSAEEATKFGTEIFKAINAVSPRGGARLGGDVAEYVGRLSGALKEAGGNAADVKDLLVSMTQVKGLTGASILGLQPGFLATKEGTQEGVRRFVSYVGSQLDGLAEGTQGYMMQVDLLAQMFGTSTDMIVNAREMQANYNRDLKGGVDLQKAWREQTGELSKAISKVVNSGKAIIQEIILPFLQAARPAFELVADFMQALAKHAYAVYVVGIPLGVVLIATVFSFAQLTKEMLKAAAASFALKASLMASTTGTTGNMFAAAWLGKALPWLGRLLSTYLLPAAIAFAGGYAIGTIIDTWIQRNKQHDENKNIRQLMSSGGTGETNLVELTRSMVRMASREVPYNVIEQYALRNIRTVRGLENQSPLRIQALVADMMSDVSEGVKTQMVRRVELGGLTAQVSGENTKYLADMAKYLQVIAGDTKFRNDLAKAALDGAKEQAEKARAMDDAIARDAALSKPSYEWSTPLRAPRTNSFF